MDQIQKIAKGIAEVANMRIDLTEESGKDVFVLWDTLSPLNKAVLPTEFDLNIFSTTLETILTQRGYEIGKKETQKRLRQLLGITK